MSKREEAVPWRQRGWLGGLAAMVGGLLWVPYGVLEMLEPYGTAKVYRDEVGYALVTNPPLFVASSLPGSLAVLLTSVALLGLFASLRGLRGWALKIGRLLTLVALGLGVLSLAGVVALLDPLFTVGRVFGSLALGAATVLAALAARGAAATPEWTLALLSLGLMGLFLLPLWPLVYAVELVPPAGGAVFMALFGLGWVALGYALWSDGGAGRAVEPR